MSIQILRPGLLTTVQDGGRRGYRRDGVSFCGALDLFALQAANILAGNAPDAAALEITLAGCQLRFDTTKRIAVCGGDLAPQLEGQPLPAWRPIRVSAGSTLDFRERISGCRAYLAIKGSLDVPRVLGSFSTDLRARIGGFDGRALRAGDILTTCDSSGEHAEVIDECVRHTSSASCAAPHWFVSSRVRPQYSHAPTLRVLRGRDFARFDEQSTRAFFADEYTISAEANRMAYRLSGSPLKLTRPHELSSSAIAPGAIQVPPGGDPVLLLADCQTIGGYPVIAHVISTDLPLVAQTAPGERLRFSEVTLTEAHRLYLNRESDLMQLRHAVQLKTP